MNAAIHCFVLTCLLAAMAWCAVAGARAETRTGSALVHSHTQPQRQFIPGGLALPHAPSHVVALARRTAEPSA
jgi:hypothetical protein